LNTFRAPKVRFLAKHHISGHYKKIWIFRDFLEILGGSGHFQPIPDNNFIGQNRKNREKSDFSKICYIVAGNMMFGRKLAFGGLESIQKPYIDHPTQYGVIL